MASIRTTSRNTAHSAKARRSRIFNKDKVNMRDEIIVAGDEDDAKILSPEPTKASDQHPPLLDGEDALSEYDLLCPGDIDRGVALPPPGWPLDGRRRSSSLQRQRPSYTPVFGRNQLECPSSFIGLFCRITNNDSPSDASSSVESLSEGIKPIVRQRASWSRPAKQKSVSKASQKRTRKGASRDDHDQEGDCLMGAADVPKKQEDNGPWVCPFFRRDPTHHMDCITLTLNRIQDVKQHLTRRHTAELYCSVCFQEFHLRQDWAEHVKRMDCQQQPCPRHRVTPQAQDRLKVRVDRTMTASEQWYEIWKILFEDEALPPSPQQSSVLGEVINIIRDCWHEERGQILSEFARSEGISEDEASMLGMLLPGLLNRVQDRVDPLQRDSGASEAHSSADNSNSHMAGHTRKTLRISSSGAPPPAGRRHATPQPSKCPSPATPITILPDISTSNFQPLKLEPFNYDPSPQEDSFVRMMGQPYAASADNDELATMTFSGQLEENYLETRGLLSYMDPILDYHGLGTSIFASNNPVWDQYSSQPDIFDGNDVNGLEALVSHASKRMQKDGTGRR